jgi:single-strand DNA-binding protein
LSKNKKNIQFSLKLPPGKWRNKSSLPLFRKKQEKGENMNKVILSGRLTKAPEVRFLPSGMQVTTFSIAVARKFKDKNGNWNEEVSYFDIETFGKVAQRAAESLNKGYQVLIEGQLKQEKYQDKNGNKKSKIKIIASKVNLLGKPKSATANAQNTKAEEVEEEIAF